jgi:hypothetical protein
MASDTAPPVADTGGITSKDYWEARWAKALADAKAEDDKALLAHTESEWHSGRFRFGLLGCDFGVPGAALTQTGIWGHRELGFPMEIATWSMMASPAAASAVVDVLVATDLAAFAAGSYASICGGSGNRPTLSSQRGASGAVLGVWPTAKLEAGNVVVFQLVSVSGSGLHVLTCQLKPRRT